MMSGTKPCRIGRRSIMEAYGRAYSNGGVVGVDGVSLAEFEKDWQNHLHSMCERMRLGSYMQPPGKLVEIPEKG